MIEKKEKLHDIKYKSTYIKIFDPSCLYEICEVNTGIYH